MTMTVNIAGDVFILQFNTISEACEFLKSYSKNNRKDSNFINMMCEWGDDDDN